MYILDLKKKKKSVLCIPAASPQEASDQPGPAMTYVRSWGPCQTQHASLVLYCQPHFLALCSIRSANNRTSLCLRFLKDSRSGRKRKKKKKKSYLSHSIHCHMQTVQTATCKWDHMPAHELVQQCFLQSAVYSHSWSSKLMRKKVYSCKKVYP